MALPIATLCTVVADAGQSTGRLPDLLGCAPARVATTPFRSWSLEDVIEITRITGTSISAQGSRIAFVVKRSFVDSGETRFAVYVLSGRRSFCAKKIVESAYIADLARHPGTELWTIRADFGAGVQLYDIDDGGTTKPLLINPETGLVGTWLGLQAGLDLPHMTGVLSYQWALDGSAFWYSRFRLRTTDEAKSVTDDGIPYDDRTMTPLTPENHPGLLIGTELRVVNSTLSEDRLVAFAPANAFYDLSLFNHRAGTAVWDPDSLHIRYTLWVTGEGANYKSVTWISDGRGGLPRPLSSDLVLSGLDSVVSLPGANKYLAIRSDGGHRVLVELRADGSVSKTYGPVSYMRLNGNEAARENGAAGKFVLNVHYADHDGLVSLPTSRARKAFTQSNENLSECDFSPIRQRGVCVRENLTTPPELVEISTDRLGISTLVRPNASLDRIIPLKSEAAEWTNRFGHRSTGYITYPRSFAPGNKYPVVVVTHGRDAQNRFAYDGFQWSFPVQVFPEENYFVLSVNEPDATLEERALLQERFGEAKKSGPRQVQFNLGVDAVASMEAAVQDLIGRGWVDGERVGIAGYSRGAEVVVSALTQSKMFKAGITGDGGLSVSGYWLTRVGREWQRALYGGSPFDPDPSVIENYRRFAPEFRISEFTGPLLQLVPSAKMLEGYELNGLLQEAGIPTELVYFPDESHVFWNPRHQLAAMRWSLEWFDYWLRGRCNLPVSERIRCAQWAEMDARWKAALKTPASVTAEPQRGPVDSNVGPTAPQQHKRAEAISDPREMSSCGANRAQAQPVL
jgi:dipeptidyl aminopeptidase/acylaminoacyl peptidase